MQESTKFRYQSSFTNFTQISNFLTSSLRITQKVLFPKNFGNCCCVFQFLKQKCWYKCYLPRHIMGETIMDLNSFRLLSSWGIYYIVGKDFYCYQITFDVIYLFIYYFLNLLDDDICGLFCMLINTPDPKLFKKNFNKNITS